jgi:hypothetical protein
VIRKSVFCVQESRVFMLLYKMSEGSGFISQQFIKWRFKFNNDGLMLLINCIYFCIENSKKKKKHKKVSPKKYCKEKESFGMGDVLYR